MDNKVLFIFKDTTAIFKLVGTLLLNRSPGFDQCIERLFKEDKLTDVIIDLSETEYMDSTNLGLLAKIARKLQKSRNRKVTLFRSNDELKMVFESMGFDSIFEMVDTPLDDDYQLKEITENKETTNQQALRFLETHKLLASLNANNAETFADVIDLLEREVADLDDE